MRFRFVLSSLDEDPEGRPLTQGNDVGTGLRRLRYEHTGDGIHATKWLKSGRSKSWELSNFTARIVRDLILDDGEHQGRQFGVEAKVNGKTITFDLSVGEFMRMNWVLPRLGPEAIIYPGQQQHARAAIQALSGPIQQARIFSHLGWRKSGSRWTYLHAGGGLSADGPVADVEVS